MTTNTGNSWPEILAAEMLTQRARLTPERLALVDLHTGHRYTYAQVNTRACQAANLLRAIGVTAGDRVAILAHNSLPYIDLLFGLMKIGAIFAPLNWRLTAHELDFIVRDSQPAALLCGPEFTPVLETLRPALNGTRLLTLEGAQIAGGLDYETALLQAAPGEPLRPPLSPDTPACILYTSGTTGKPKGALLPQRQVLWNSINTVVSWGLNEKDIAPILTPMFHAGGLFIFLTPLFYAGGQIVLARSFDPETSLQLIETEGCTVVLGVPTLFQMWQAAPNFARADFSRVRFFISGGAACPPALMDHWRETKQVEFRQGYGLTEVGVNCFSITDEQARRKPGSVGKPIFHSEMLLVDPESGQEVPPGRAGELLIRGPHVCLGYWRNPQATLEALRDGWFHTGDMARQDQDGYFYIVGRYKDMIKSGGENIYAAEVEAVFREHPKVADAALIGQPDEKWGEVGLMVVLPKPGCAPSAEELLELCRERLARFKIPKRVIFTETLPYSPYGKIQKAELRKQYLNQE